MAIKMMLLFLIFGAVWILGLSSWVADTGATAVEDNAEYLNGFEKFFYSNLNLFIGIAFLLGLVALARYGFG